MDTTDSSENGETAPAVFADLFTTDEPYAPGTTISWTWGTGTKNGDEDH